jgi:hypothetical protein
MTATATDKQIGYIRSLDAQAGGHEHARRVSDLQAKFPQRIRSKLIDDLSKSEASEVIDRLKHKVA